LSSLDLSFNLVAKAYPSFVPVDLHEACLHYGALVPESDTIQAVSLPHPSQYQLWQKDLSAQIEEKALSDILMDAVASRKAHLTSLQQ